MKRVYFVRHGESALNVTHTHQFSHTELSVLGERQAKTLARRFRRIPIDIILASSYRRAKQTAAILRRVIKKRVLILPVLREMKRPSEIKGLKADDPYAQEIKDLIRRRERDPCWRFSDEETFTDFRRRAARFLKYLESRSEDRVLVVTHGGILRMMLAVMVFGHRVGVRTARTLSDALATTNTGITVCEYRGGKWRVVTWNDHAHLG